VAQCDTFQRKKEEIIKTPHTLQPLPIPLTIWTDISMDFIGTLPKYDNKLVIMVVVDFLSKYDNFCSL
jgi:hypothetical protein